VEKLLNPSQLADILGVKLGTIYSWLSRGVNVPHVKIEGTVRFREKAIEAWILEREREKKRKNFEI
jgi:excisionase family DNA binding protein